HPRLNKFLNNDPSSAQIESWNSRTKTRCFDALEDASKHRKKVVLCPLCQKPHNIRSFTLVATTLLIIISIAFINVSGTGYLQSKFQFVCFNRSCTTLNYIDTSVLLVRKFAEDFVREDDTPQSYLAYAHLIIPDPALSLIPSQSSGTLRTMQTPADFARARRIKAELLSAGTSVHPPGSVVNETRIQVIIQKSGYSFIKLWQRFPPPTMLKKQKPMFVLFVFFLISR
ncbi:hypothetical protein H0H87_009502, partial [Tephrocybe sp. NHM501043]